MATPNMNLTIPAVSLTAGPEWATQINGDLSLIDSHNHTFGNGALIPTAALNIDASLSFNNTFAATNLAYVQYNYSDPVLEPISMWANQDGDLFWSNGAGTPVQITSGTSVVGANGTITGLVPPASVSFDAYTGTFTFMQNATQHGLLDIGPLKLRTTAATSNAVTLTPATGTSAYTLTLPTAPPSAANLVGIGSSGALSNVSANSTLTVTSSSISIANLGVTEPYIATDAVTTSKIKNGNVTPQKLSAANQISSASSTFNGSITSAQAFAGPVNFYTLVDRPFIIMLRPDNSTNLSRISASNGNYRIYFEVNGPSGVVNLGEVLCLSGSSFPPAAFQAYVVPPPGGGGYTITAYINRISFSTALDVFIDNVALTVYSL